MNERIVEIAKTIRRRCEIFAMSPRARKYDFYRRSDLCCMCAVASFALKHALRRNKIFNEVIVGWLQNQGHCWVEVDGYIVDITATQFINFMTAIRFSSVHIVASPDQSYRKQKICRSPSSLKHWPHTQYPDSNAIREIINIDP